MYTQTQEHIYQSKKTKDLNPFYNRIRKCQLNSERLGMRSSTLTKVVLTIARLVVIKFPNSKEH